MTNAYTRYMRSRFVTEAPARGTYLMGGFDRLAAALFDGPVKAADVKTMPGDDPSPNRERLATALHESMQRMGLIVDGHLVNKLEPKG